AEAARVVPGAEHDLCVAHTGRGQILAELDGQPAEVPQVAEEPAELEVVVDEICRSPETPPVSLEAVGERGTVAIGQLPQQRGASASLEVDVQLHLGKRPQVAHLSMVAAAPVRPLGSLRRWAATPTVTRSWRATASSWSPSCSTRRAGRSCERRAGHRRWRSTSVAGPARRPR